MADRKLPKNWRHDAWAIVNAHGKIVSPYADGHDLDVLRSRAFARKYLKARAANGNTGESLVRVTIIVKRK